MIVLTAEFETVAELHEWLLAQARSIRSDQPVVPAAAEVKPIAEQISERRIEHQRDVEAVADITEKALAKPKRKRRTKKEMEAARAAEEKKAAEAEAELKAVKAINTKLKEIGAAHVAEKKAAEAEAEEAVVTELDASLAAEPAKPTGGNGNDSLAEELQLQQRFRAVMESDFDGALELLKAPWTDPQTGEVHGQGFTRFSLAPLARQKEMVEAMGG